MTALSLDRLKELLIYSPETGEFIRLKGVKGAAAGTVAGGLMVNGYITITVDRKVYLAHRLAWFYMTGLWPKEYIDHADGSKANNRWANLREATQTQQNANTKTRVDNTSGFKGVSWDARKKRWRARVHVSGKEKFLGYHSSLSDAQQAYVVGAKKHFGEFARPT